MLRRKFLILVGLGTLTTWRTVIAASENAPLASPADLIRQAVVERRRLRFSYSDHPRNVEPHALGRTRDGKLAILAWQVAGGSTTEPPPGWRTFIVADINDLALTEETFPGPRPDYRAERSGLAEIEIEVGAAPKA
jgi:predicted DNA-binding transcriptional regulator YafY